MTQLEGKFLRNFWIAETPTGAINGTNVSFSLSSLPMQDESVLVFLDGLLQRQGPSFDYQISGQTITFNSAPQVGQWLRVAYIKERG